MNDKGVSDRTRKRQIPESPMRPPFVKARVKVHVHPDGSHALFHRPRRLGRCDGTGRRQDDGPVQRAAELRSAADLWTWGPVDMGTTPRLAHIPTGEQNPKQRIIHALPKPDTFIRYRQEMQEFLRRHGPDQAVLTPFSRR
jgi:hypothetical protein